MREPYGRAPIIDPLHDAISLTYRLGPGDLATPGAWLYRCFLPDLTGFRPASGAQDPVVITAKTVSKDNTGGPLMGIQSRSSGLRVTGHR